MYRYRQEGNGASQITARRHKPDYWLVILPTLLTAIGLIVVFAISPALSTQKKVAENYFVYRQLIAVVLSIIFFFLIANVHYSFWRTIEKPLIIAAAIAAIAVRLFGEEVNGAYRWIQVGGLSFQAAELIKFAVLFWLAGFLASRIQAGALQKTDAIKPIIALILLIGVVVAVIQSDFGSAAVMMAMIGFMLFVANFPLQKIVIVGAVLLLGGVLVIATSPYRRQRLQTFAQPAKDCQAEGYQTCQALIAVGSGGMFGLGLAKSVQAYGYLPEAANDSIFAIYAEKFGFIGTSILLGLFLMFFAKIKKVLDRAPDDYSRLLVAGIFAWLVTQSFINIGAMVGLLPLKGITLPFISYGGTSLIFVASAAALVFNISRYTVLSERINAKKGTAEYENIAGRRGERRSYYAASGRS